ncbi:class I SAM-dependent methyltransferase [Arenibaculum pallidiluteum]|uniref:class I SAM-dependent methyltransferase n=1 Tax=Arenibaculum pallidiluteum TaxID=2812559 RepID=UPI001A95E996|nr:class I SAM-dependent methyltransferase [Arenibaculum pallidiluteum]
MIGPSERLAYRVGQAVRVSWFLGQYALAARFGGAESVPPASGPAPGAGTLLAELRALLARDLANVEAGYYRMPHDLVVSPLKVLRETALFLGDLPAVARRRRARDGLELRAEDAGRGLPAYYRQNFHFQTDGYLSDRSAELYDHQVEVLFGGGADAMRRQALPPIARWLEGRRSSDLVLLDVAAGTGRFLTFVKDNWPRLGTVALDLSLPYLQAARRNLAPWRRAGFVQAPAEAMPLADASVDIVTCIFLFHELPRGVRIRAAAEIARVLRPGGLAVIVDSIQTGDRPEMDGLLRRFPTAFHEPYYAEYLGHDLANMFTELSLEQASSDMAFLSKVLTFVKTSGGGGRHPA